MLPLHFDDGRHVPQEWIGEALSEVSDRFSRYGTQGIKGRGPVQTIPCENVLVRCFVDVPDNVKSRAWMKKFKHRWNKRLEQLELWMVSYRIEVE